MSLVSIKLYYIEGGEKIQLSPDYYTRVPVNCPFALHLDAEYSQELDEPDIVALKVETGEQGSNGEHPSVLTFRDFVELVPTGSERLSNGNLLNSYVMDARPLKYLVPNLADTIPANSAELEYCEYLTQVVYLSPIADGTQYEPNKVLLESTAYQIGQDTGEVPLHGTTDYVACEGEEVYIYFYNSNPANDVTAVIPEVTEEFYALDDDVAIFYDDDNSYFYIDVAE